MPASGHQPAFLINTGKGRTKPLIYGQLQEKIKGLISTTGRDSSLYSTHSLRRGGCSWAFKAGVPTNLIQHHGDWFSDWAYAKTWSGVKPWGGVNEWCGFLEWFFGVGFWSHL